jgi:hypothetical protein
MWTRQTASGRSFFSIMRCMEIYTGLLCGTVEMLSLTIEELNCKPFLCIQISMDAYFWSA